MEKQEERNGRRNKGRKKLGIKKKTNNQANK
jgi:hypothetical protein